jgi:hypothetical protein
MPTKIKFPSCFKCPFLSCEKWHFSSICLEFCDFSYVKKRKNSPEKSHRKAQLVFCLFLILKRIFKAYIEVLIVIFD